LPALGRATPTGPLPRAITNPRSHSRSGLACATRWPLPARQAHSPAPLARLLVPPPAARWIRRPHLCTARDGASRRSGATTPSRGFGLWGGLAPHMRRIFGCRTVHPIFPSPFVPSSRSPPFPAAPMPDYSKRSDDRTRSLAPAPILTASLLLPRRAILSTCRHGYQGALPR